MKLKGSVLHFHLYPRCCSDTKRILPHQSKNQEIQFDIFRYARIYISVLDSVQHGT